MPSSAATEKKRKVNGVEGENNPSQSNEVLCPSNGQADSCISQQEENQANLIKNWEEGKMSNEQVEALLNTKILGKTKFDLKVCDYWKNIYLPGLVCTFSSTVYCKDL